MRQSVKAGILSAAVLVSVTLAALAQAPAPNPQDPKYQSKGEQDRTYTFPGTTEMIPYHVYVPMKWDKNTKLPLVIVTHGASQLRPRRSCGRWQTRLWRRRLRNVDTSWLP